MTDSPSSSESGSQRERLLHVPVSELQMPPHAPKTGQASESMVASIGTYGILQPLLVRPGAEGYEVVAGFKRLQAAKIAGLSDVPVRVYRVEDEAMESLYDASNVRSESRQRVSIPQTGAYKPSGKLGGLLEEELNRAPSDVPYKSIMTVAAVILLIVWAGIAIKKRLPSRDPENTAVATATPKAGGGIIESLTGIDPPVNAANRISVARWQLLLSDVEGIEVRNESDIPRVVFSEPVFSRLTTIDPDQKPRLEQILRIVRQTNPSAVLTVIGHTDNDQIRPGSEYRSNEYLSELRAKEVVKFLSETRILPAPQLRAVGVGAEEPPFPNSPAASKAKNRTVSIEIMQPVN